MLNRLQRLAQLDWWLMGSCTILMAFSIMMMYGISEDTFNKQLLFAVIGLILMCIVSQLNFRLVQHYAIFIYIFGAVILIAVLFFGQTIRGTTGWFNIAGFSIQPVEMAKIFLLITLARYVSDHNTSFNQWRSIIVSFGIVALYAVLVLLQPDFGSMAVFSLAFIVIILLTNIRLKQLLLIALISCIVATSAWFLVFQDYQKKRILTFLDPSLDALGSGYNVTQSIISVGSGKIFGRGLGLGTQSQLQFLPERETDFIFAVIAEELGLIGSTVVLLLLACIIWRLWRITQKTNDLYSIYYCAGLAGIFFIQSLINIGMNIGIMPVTGIPLPLVSAGGSSLFSLLIGVGIAQNCYIQAKK